MAQAVKQYQQQIQYLRLSGDMMLDQIRTLESNMNRRKQQNEQPFIEEINLLNILVKKLLKMLAEINVCEYFKLTNPQFNLQYYNDLCDRQFNYLMYQFLQKLHIRRIERLNLIDFQRR